MPERSGASGRRCRAADAQRFALVALVASVALGGCASVQPDPYQSEPIARHLERNDDVGYCARLFSDIDRRVDVLGVRDAEAPRIEGFPYLRVDRFSAALADRAAKDGPPRRAWLERLAKLDDTGRSAELANAALPGDDIARCRVLLADADAARFDELRDRARVPDAYNEGLRAAGLYPLTRYAFAAGVERFNDATREVFATPLAQLPVGGTLTRFQVRAASPLPAVELPVPSDPLGVPALSRFDLAALLLRHAPVLEIDVQGGHDRPGTLGLDGAGLPVVDIGQPVAYTRLEHALIDGVVHLQLVYTFWFSERPARSLLDPLSGRIDGLVWRVTLDRDGVPLVYDTIHPCGCYHLFFPTERAVARPRPDTLDEGLFAPQGVRAPREGEAVVLRVESATHYVQRVSVEPRSETAVRYQLEDARQLTTLPVPGGGTRSAYGSDGMMPGTERGERWYFWPMGVESAGQMRQWGHHATAFVGRRHFDDPRLIDAYFARRAGAPARAPAP